MSNKNGLSILTLFGLGNSKKAPGTVASLVTCVIYIFLYFLNIKAIILLFFLIIVSIYSIVLIDKTLNKFKNKDPKEIVIDEFIGQSIPMLFIYHTAQYDWLSIRLDGEDFFVIFISFISFRFFDIIKTYPINLVDKKMKNGLGVVLDDVIAGIYSLIVIWVYAVVFNWHGYGF